MTGELLSSCWEFHRRQPKMALTTSIFNNVLQTSGFTVEERLIREALQNSVDAAREKDGLPVSVRIERHKFTGAEKESLVAALELSGEPAERRHLFELPPENALEKIADPTEPLTVLTISDYNTVGLGGVWDGTGKGDHFGRLVVNLGIDDKADATEISGGSFGFGKTVYGKASRIGVVVFYSVFEPSDATGGAHARFMATGLFKAHEYQGVDYDGFAFFGAPIGSGSEEVGPLIDDAAHRMAERCGLSVRSPDELGTTIAVIDCDYKTADLVAATERYWWPRLIRNELDVTFIDGEVESVPRPRQNDILKPFISCYQNLLSNVEDPPKTALLTSKRRIGSSRGRLDPGVLSAALLEGESELENCAALVRGPGMVVRYHKCGMDAYPSCVGVFVADPDVEKYLTYSEPPMHDHWDENSDRLRRKFPEDGGKVVRFVMRRTETLFRDFQRKQEPPVPPGALKPRELSKLLSRFLQVKGLRQEPPPPGDPRPISIGLAEDRVVRPDGTWDQAAISLSLKPDTRTDEIDCRVTAFHEVLGDASLRMVGRSECIIEDEAGMVLATGNPPVVQITLKKGESVKLVARAASEEVAVTRMRVAVEEVL